MSDTTVTKFAIASAATENYRGIAELLVPTWERNSGADAVLLDYFGPCERWRLMLIERAECWRRRVIAAVADRQPLVLLDVDCAIVAPIIGGFSDTHPISVARWPNINIGVIFLNTLIDWPFAEFFDEFVNRLRAARAEKCADQNLMESMLHAREEDICKLDARVWNLTYGVGDGSERLQKYPNGKILHLHWSNWGRVGSFQAQTRLAKAFPEAFDEP